MALCPWEGGGGWLTSGVKFFLDITSYLNFYISLDDQYTLRDFECLKLRKNYARTSDFK